MNKNAGLASTAASASSITVTRLCVVASGIVSGVVTARTLGPTGRGEYFAVTTAAMLLAQTLNLGLTSSNVFLGAKDGRTIWPLLVNGMWLAAGSLMFGVALVVIFGQHISQVLVLPEGMLLAVCFLGAAMLLWNLAVSLLVAMQRFTALNAWQIANAGLTLLVILGCVFASANPTEFSFATAAAATVSAIGLCIFIARGRTGPPRFSLELARAGVGFSFRAYGALLFGYFLQRSGASLLALRGQPAALGEYSVASQIFDVLLIVPASISMVLFPRLVRSAEDSWPEVRRTLMLTVLLMLILCGLAAATAPWLVPLLFGPKFSGATQVLWYLLPAVIAYAVTGVLSQYLVARGYPWSLMLAWACGLATVALIGPATTARNGAVGAALAQSVGSALVGVLVVLLTQRRVSTRLKVPRA